MSTPTPSTASSTASASSPSPTTPCDVNGGDTDPAAQLERIQERYEAAGPAPSRLRVLSIEGTDPIGGAGTMADMKAFTAHGVYGYAAVTSVLAQNTQGVSAIVNLEPAFLLAQLKAVSEDALIDAIKIGMLGTPELVDAVRGWLGDLLERYRREGRRAPTVVLDPVMYAKSGDRLLTDEAETALISLFGLSDIVTPNTRELAALAGHPGSTPDSYEEIEHMAQTLAARHGVAVVAKGGGMALRGDPSCTDILAEPGLGTDGGVRITRLEGRSIRTDNVHGAGDTLSSTLAALRPQYDTLAEAARAARTWMNGAIAAADGLEVGTGHGPIDVTWRHSPTGLRFTEDYWHRTAAIRQRIESMDFIARMLDGTLPLEDFSYYLHQDDLYLQDYTSLLAQASARARTIDDRVFFAKAASFGVREGLDLHRTWFAAHGFDAAHIPMSQATAAYIGHEHRIADMLSYPALVSVVMPCYWVYSMVGSILRRRAEDDHMDLDTHPYGPWIRMYADTEFSAKTLQELRICDRLARESGHDEYELMMEAALGSTEHEYRFFDQALRRAR
ncbi:bifunctional hydroxymethylpyrimidine kinase/phosphomethylpyrimidine kinase [Bifidobacterium mongoliense]|uniref:bifunctional hydroxymethylpyrimidine kinase/phosphomethylpyrimidine kinase n=1 Tax=Bifidobacterium mongoliense TaxID=518643 RepID=UPI002A7639F9|nr:bifunctional hydroxymethylpyrimidine kinase/phosphomethylpyrimidine kinase [Bifidobacterium mongoliense]MDY3125803.1 bifunctional hydroxymethylpyrimidine kinase/phosphomethylpyrimidine kinase [Bifidobacterium mongoliense]